MAKVGFHGVFARPVRQSWALELAVDSQRAAFPGARRRRAEAATFVVMRRRRLYGGRSVACPPSGGSAARTRSASHVDRSPN